MSERAGPMAVRFSQPERDWLKDYAAIAGTSPHALVKRAVQQFRAGIESGRNLESMTAQATATPEVVAITDPRGCREHSYGNGAMYVACWRLAGHLERGEGPHLDLSHKLLWMLASGDTVADMTAWEGHAVPAPAPAAAPLPPRAPLDDL